MENRINLPLENVKRWKGKPSEFYRYVLGYQVGGTGHPIEEADVPTFAEQVFIKDGQPYYKVWPHIGAEFTKTNLQIAAEYIHFPYEVYEIKLPQSNVLPLYDYYRSIMVVGLQKNQFHDLKLLATLDDADDLHTVLYLFWDSNNYPNQDKYDWAYIPLSKGETLEEAVNRLMIGQDYHTGQKTVNKLHNKFPHFIDMAKIVLSVTMFAIGQHEMVLPDIDTPLIDRNKLGRGKKLKFNLEQLKKQHEKEIAKCKGWKIGSEIDLPTPDYVGSYQKQSGDVQELTHGHIRSGHMRWQPHGENRQERRLQYIPPAVVRPDLPLRQTHGYRIKDDIKRIS